MIILGSKIHKAVRARTKKALCIFDPHKHENGAIYEAAEQFVGIIKSGGTKSRSCLHEKGFVYLRPAKHENGAIYEDLLC